MHIKVIKFIASPSKRVDLIMITGNHVHCFVKTEIYNIIHINIVIQIILMKYLIFSELSLLLGYIFLLHKLNNCFGMSGQ